MSVNFNFLKDINRNLFELAKKIEDAYIDYPEAVLTMGTSFLDNLVYQIYNISNRKMERTTSIERVNTLENDGIITAQLADQLTNGFKLRNVMHDPIKNIDDYFSNNKTIARMIYDHVYMAAYDYYIEFHDSNFSQNHQNPDQIMKFFETQDKCPVCGSKAKINSILCPECDYKTELFNELKLIINHIGIENNFKIDQLEEKYSKSEAKRLLIDLRNKGLIKKQGIVYTFNKESIKEFKPHIDDITEIQDIVLQIGIDNLNATKIKNTETYIKGSKGQEPFICFYELVLSELNSEFEDNIQNNNYVDVVDNFKIFTIEEFQNWANNNLDNKLFFNQLKTNYLDLKEKCENDECIMEKMHITKDILNVIKNDSLIKKEVIEIQKMNYIKALVKSKTFDEALTIAKLTDKKVIEYRKEDKDFRDKIDNEILRRKSRFLVDLKNYGFKDAFEKSKLKKIHILEECNRSNKSEFYYDMMRIQQDKFLKLRISGKTQKECIDICQISDDRFNKWCNNPNFTKKLSDIEIKLLFNSIDSENDLSKGLKLAGWNSKKFNKYIIEAYKNQDYDIIELYESNVLPKVFNVFLKHFEKKNEKKSIKASNFDKKLLDIALENNLELANIYLAKRKEKFCKLSLTNNKMKAIKKSDLTKEEYKLYEAELKDTIEKLARRTFLDAFKKYKNGNNKHPTKRAAREAGVELRDMYQAYHDGQYKVGELMDFAIEFEDLIIKPTIEFEYIRKSYTIPGKDRKFTSQEVKMLKEVFLLSDEDERLWDEFNILAKFADVDVEFVEAPMCLAC